MAVRGGLLLGVVIRKCLMFQETILKALVLNSLLSLETRPVVSGGHTNQHIDTCIMIVLFTGCYLRCRKQMSFTAKYTPRAEYHLVVVR